MKRVCAALILGLSISSLCLAQTQIGDASYNSLKAGLTISHPSLSFNTRVRVTNLVTNQSVEAVVNGRIPITADRIADISRDTGDAIKMDKEGMTLVEIEVLPVRQAAAPDPVPEPVPVPVPVSNPVPAPIPVPAPAPSPPSAQTQAPQRSASERPAPASRTLPPASPPAPVPVPVPAPADPQTVAPQVLPIQTVTDVQYIPLPAAAPCCNAYLLMAVFVLLIVAVILLTIILVILLRHWPGACRPWYYPIWLRRHFRYHQKRRS